MGGDKSNDQEVVIEIVSTKCLPTGTANVKCNVIVSAVSRINYTPGMMGEVQTAWVDRRERLLT